MGQNATLSKISTPPRSPPIVMPFVLNRERASILRVIQPTCYMSHVYACAANPAHFNRDNHEIAVQERMHNHRGYIYLSSNTRVRNDTDYSILSCIPPVNVPPKNVYVSLTDS